MIKGIKNWWNKHSVEVVSKVIIGLVVAGVLGVIVFIGSKIKEVNFFPYITSILIFQLPIWIYLSFSFFVIILILIFNKRRSVSRIENLDHYFDPPPVVMFEKSLNPSVQVNKNLIFDSNIFNETAWHRYGQQNWDSAASKLVGDIGRGKFHINNNIITIDRENKEGRYIIAIKDYYYRGEKRSYIPADIYGKARRGIQVIFFARTFADSAKIFVILKRNGKHDWILSEYFDFTKGEWDKKIVGFSIESKEDFTIEFQTHITAGQGGIIQIKDLLIQEVGN